MVIKNFAFIFNQNDAIADKITYRFKHAQAMRFQIRYHHKWVSNYDNSLRIFATSVCSSNNAEMRGYYWVF